MSKSSTIQNLRERLESSEAALNRAYVDATTVRQVAYKQELELDTYKMKFGLLHEGEDPYELFIITGRSLKTTTVKGTGFSTDYEGNLTIDGATSNAKFAHGEWISCVRAHALP